MHDTAMASGEEFFRYYGTRLSRILDVGSADVNGTLRPVAPTGSTYVGIDLTDGPGVDVPLRDPYKFPFLDSSFDLIVSSSCFEHDPMFWLTFLEMCRVRAPDGYIYLSAPANGPYHGHPGDCWRFYADSGKALVEWAKRNKHDISLLESFHIPPRHDIWIDYVAIFGKSLPPSGGIRHLFT